METDFCLENCLDLSLEVSYETLMTSLGGKGINSKNSTALCSTCQGLGGGSRKNSEGAGEQHGGDWDRNSPVAQPSLMSSTRTKEIRESAEFSF